MRAKGSLQLANVLSDGLDATGREGPTGILPGGKDGKTSRAVAPEIARLCALPPAPPQKVKKRQKCWDDEWELIERFIGQLSMFFLTQLSFSKSLFHLGTKYHSYQPSDFVISSPCFMLFCRLDL